MFIHFYQLLMMRKILFILAVFWVFAAHAVSPPASLKYLDGFFNEDPDAALTLVTGKPLKTYQLDEYRGLTLNYDPEKTKMIEDAVKADARIAEDKEISYRKGALYYAFLTLPPTKEGKKRYLFYLNQKLAKGDKVILIYMSGKASAQTIKKMIKK